MATPESSAPAQPSTRTTRGLALYRERAGEIERIGPHLYAVPSCTSGKHQVSTRPGYEACTCRDFEHHGGVCKHLYAALIFRSKSGECAVCRVHRPRRELREAGPDHLGFYEDDLLCKPCARRHGAL